MNAMLLSRYIHREQGKIISLITDEVLEQEFE